MRWKEFHLCRGCGYDMGCSILPVLCPKCGACAIMNTDTEKHLVLNPWDHLTAWFHWLFA